MLSDELKKFGESNKQVTSRDIVEAAERRMQNIMEMWANSPSGDYDGREELYREYRGIQHALSELTRSWR